LKGSVYLPLEKEKVEKWRGKMGGRGADLKGGGRLYPNKKKTRSLSERKKGGSSDLLPAEEENTCLEGKKKEIPGGEKVFPAHP